MNSRWLALAGAVLTLAGASTASAQTIVVEEGYVAPAYGIAPAPVYSAPAIVAPAVPVYVAPAPRVYVAPAPVYAAPAIRAAPRRVIVTEHAWSAGPAVPYYADW